MARPNDHDARMRRVRLALDGLSVGEAFGTLFVHPPPGAADLIATQTLPAGPWEHSAQTQMALAVASVLQQHASLDRNTLASALAARYEADPGRGYESMAHWVLASVAGGLGWDEAAKSVHDGAGSRGFDAAARAALAGAYFAPDLAAVSREAQASAEPTHAHADGHAGAVAVALAAAAAAQRAAGTPAGPIREGDERARALLLEKTSLAEAASALGVGKEALASDTVPFALFCAARAIDDFAEVMWSVAGQRGRPDAIAAMAGAVVALTGSVPAEWIEAREPLPD